MAKTGGKVSQKTPRSGKRLGVKLFGGQKALPGNIILRQRGSCFHPGVGTQMGRDFTIFAIRSGTINFRKLRGKQIVEVL